MTNHQDETRDVPVPLSVLRGIARWSRFISLTGFCFIGFFLVLLFTGLATRTLPALRDPALTTAGRTAFLVLYGLLVAGLAYPLSRLYRFSSRCSQAIKTNDGPLLNRALSELLAFFRFIGILLLLFVAIYFLVFLLASLAMLFGWGKQ